VSQHRRIVFGPLNGRITPDHQSIFDISKELASMWSFLKHAKVLWTKFVFISAVSSLVR